MPTNDTFYIAWHPEYGYFLPSLATEEESSQDMLEQQSISQFQVGHTIRQICIIEASKVEEMWELLLLPKAPNE